MRKLYLKRIFILLITVIVFSSCTTVPYTGRKQFIITSPNDEITLGEKAWIQFKAENKLSTNKQYNEALNRVAKNITSAINESGYNWEFAVIESPMANAFCLPGGKIAVYSGFFKILSNDGELAAVVGHEIAHAIARHAGERMSQQNAAQISSEALSQVLNQQDIPVPIPWMEVFGIASNYGVILPYSRTQEYESDHIGMILMAKGGYNPQAAVDFWEKFSKKADYDSLTEFFMTHPMGSKRLTEIRDDLAIAMKYYNKAKVKHGFGQKYSR